MDISNNQVSGNAKHYTINNGMNISNNQVPGNAKHYTTKQGYGYIMQPSPG